MPEWKSALSHNKPFHNPYTFKLRKGGTDSAIGKRFCWYVLCMDEYARTDHNLKIVWFLSYLSRYMVSG